MKIAIEGIGLVGAFGVGRDAFGAALEKGRSHPTIRSFGPDGDQLEQAILEARPEGIDRFATARALRRVDDFSRLALVGAGTALEDAGLLEGDRRRTALVVATGYGATSTTFAFLDSMFDHGDECASPTRFSSSVHNSAAANVAILLGIEGPNLTVSQFEMSVPVALSVALGWLEEDLADTVVFGGVDELCAPLAYSYARYFGQQRGPMQPFDLERQTAIPGEGAAFFVLRRLKESDRLRAVIDGLQLGTADISPQTRLIVGADGHRESAAYYRPFEEVAQCFTPVYGSLPIGPAFDLAAAVCLLEQEPGRVECLKFDCAGSSAVIRLSREMDGMARA